MTAHVDRRPVAALLIAVPIVFSICFTLLGAWFEYPDILRQPTAAILTKFQAGGSALVAVWYALTLTALLFIPLAVLLHRTLAERGGSALLPVVTTFGIVAGLVQGLGFLRWPFLVPYFAQTHLAPDTSEAQRAAVAVAFDAFHRYLGMGVGEHLGYLATALWTVGVALAMWRNPQFGRALGLVGVVLAAGIASGLLEPAGVDAAGTINAVSYLAWSAWLVAVGVRLLLHREAAAPQISPAVVSTAALT